MVNQLLETGSIFCGIVWSSLRGNICYYIFRLFRGYKEEEDYDYDDSSAENHLDSIVQVLFYLCQ